MMLFTVSDTFYSFVVFELVLLYLLFHSAVMYNVINNKMKDSHPTIIE